LAICRDLVAPSLPAAFRAFIAFQEKQLLFPGLLLSKYKTGVWPDRELAPLAGLRVFHNNPVVQDEFVVLVLLILIKPAGTGRFSVFPERQLKAGADIRDVEFVVQVVDLHFGHSWVVALVDKISASTTKKIDGSGSIWSAVVDERVIEAVDRGKESAADIPSVGQSLQGGLNRALVPHARKVQGVQGCLSDESKA